MPLFTVEIRSKINGRPLPEGTDGKMIVEEETWPYAQKRGLDLFPCSIVEVTHIEPDRKTKKVATPL